MEYVSSPWPSVGAAHDRRWLQRTLHSSRSYHCLYKNCPCTQHSVKSTRFCLSHQTALNTNSERYIFSKLHVTLHNYPYLKTKLIQKETDLFKIFENKERNLAAKIKPIKFNRCTSSMEVMAVNSGNTYWRI